MEEFKQKAEEYAKENAYTSYFGDSWTDKQQEDAEWKYDVSFSALKQGYIAGTTEVTKQLDKSKEIIRELLGCLQQDTNDPETNYYVVKYIEKAEAFLEEK